MIDCKECSDYVDVLLSRGDITKDDADNVFFARHKLGNCSRNMDALDKLIDELAINQKELLIIMTKIQHYLTR